MTPASILQRGKGKGRNPWRIREYLASIGVNMNDVARMAGVHHNIVGDTVRGMRNHRRVLEQLETLGCPAEYLYPRHPLQEQGTPPPVREGRAA